MRTVTAVLVSAVLAGGAASAPAAPVRASAVAAVSVGLPPAGGNVNYPGNRPPLLPSPLVKLPLGSVKAEGWLRLQLDLMAEGFTGRLPEISRFCRYDGNAWPDPSGQGGFGWEEVPYWLRGFVDLAYLTGDKRLLDESQRWIEAVMRTQQEAGYFGSRTNLADAESGTRASTSGPTWSCSTRCARTTRPPATAA